MRPIFLALEFSPVAEEIWKIRQSAGEGYQEWKSHTGELIFLDVTNHDSKIRPEVCCIYAAGKATNVVRVLSGFYGHLGHNQHGKVALKTFLPAGKGKSFNTPKAMNEMIRLLQTGSMTQVECFYEQVEFENPDGKIRKAVHAIDRDSHHDLINFTPRLKWSPRDLEAVIDKLDNQSSFSWVILAGSPPLGAEHLHRQAITTLRERSPEQKVSLDTSGPALKYCLENEAAHPNIITINKDEYFGIDKSLWNTYSNLLLVHDKNGCWIMAGNAGRLFDHWQNVPCLDISGMQNRLGGQVGPTLGAGDAFHAGVLFAMQALGLNEKAAVKYGLAAASVAVRSGVGVADMDYGSVAEILPLFDRLETGYRNPAAE